jgi:hypothetical protein
MDDVVSAGLAIMLAAVLLVGGELYLNYEMQQLPADSVPHVASLP